MTASKPRRDRALYVEIVIRAPMERVWELTQTPELHSRWDGRFSAILPTATRDDGAQLFTYELGLGVHTIRGTGVSLGERVAENGTRTSALVFDTDDWVSPLGTGRGYWRYIPCDGGVRFITGYDYAPGWGIVGRVLDPIVTRRFVWWLTAWSFDRLRLWAESDIPPERVGWWRGWFGGTRARAANCRARPATGTKKNPEISAVASPAATRVTHKPTDPHAQTSASPSATTIMDDAPTALARIENYGKADA